MFGSEIIDVAIGLALVFGLVSALCSAIREGIESWLKTRAAFLEHAIRELLRDKEGTGLVKSVFDHPLISGLYFGDYVPERRGSRPRFWNSGKNLPSYIPGRQVALALFDMAARGRNMGNGSNPAPLSGTALESIREGVSRLENPYVQRALLCAIDTSGNDFEKALANVEAWYDGAMDRVSGWYKRSAQRMIFCIALVVVGALNVNAITLANYLYRDPVARQSVVAAAEKADVAIKYDEARAMLDGLQLPIGWSRDWNAVPSTQAESASETSWVETLSASALAVHVFGLLISALAATLGAPFWFDIANRLVTLRSSVKPTKAAASSTGSELTAELSPLHDGRPPGLDSMVVRAPVPSAAQ